MAHFRGPGSGSNLPLPDLSDVTLSLRIAIVLNPFALRLKGGDHAPRVAREMLARGHAVRVFGDLAGGVPQSTLDFGGDGMTAPLEGNSLSAFEPDVILAYDGRSPAALRGARAARKLEVPLVLVEEGFPRRGRTLERTLRLFGSRAWGGLVRRTAFRVIALDPAAALQAERAGHAPDTIVEIAPGVDTQVFRPGGSSEVLTRGRMPGHVLLHIGRVEPGRGIEVLVDALAGSALQSADWGLVFAGSGSLRDRVRAQCERLGIGARVRWIRTPRTEELPGLLGSATALLVGAIDDDVSSQKIRRAMACGTPVLVSDVARLRGLVEHEVTGMVVPAGDRDAWSAAIRRLASDPTRRARWGAAGRAVAESRMSWPRIADRVEGLLCDVARDHRAAREPRPAPAPFPAEPGNGPDVNEIRRRGA